MLRPLPSKEGREGGREQAAFSQKCRHESSPKSCCCGGGGLQFLSAPSFPGGGDQLTSAISSHRRRRYCRCKVRRKNEHALPRFVQGLPVRQRILPGLLAFQRTWLQGDKLPVPFDLRCLNAAKCKIMVKLRCSKWQSELMHTTDLPRHETFGFRIRNFYMSR